MAGFLFNERAEARPRATFSANCVSFLLKESVINVVRN